MSCSTRSATSATQATLLPARERARRATRACCAALLSALLALVGAANGAENSPFIVLQSTTSTQSSGLFDTILPQFTASSGIEVRVVAVGTGQALANCRAGNGDVALVHAAELEAQFIASGDGLARLPLMYNEFVLVGPRADPAAITGSANASVAFARIARHQALFFSRGDESGTHARERQLWSAAGYVPDPARDRWYRDTGSAMLPTLNVALELSGYTLIDRATWDTAPTQAGHAVLFEGGAELRNQYSVIVVNPRVHPAAKVREAQALADWLRGAVGQQAIAAFQPHGRPLFYPNAATLP